MSHRLEAFSSPHQTKSLKRRLVFKVAGFVALAMVVITLAAVYMMRQELRHQAQHMLTESARFAGPSTQCVRKLRIVALL